MTTDTAHQIAAQLGHDGQCYESDGKELLELIGEHRGIPTASRDGGRVTRHQFRDGSAIVDAESGWDIGFPGLADCTCWPAAHHGEHGPGCIHRESSSDERSEQ